MWGVGYMLADGQWEWSDSQKRQHNKRQERDTRRIGTKSLSTCCAVMLLSKDGALIAHLNPQNCDRFFKPDKTDEEKKADKAAQDCPADKARYKKFVKDAGEYCGRAMVRTSTSYRPIIILGPGETAKSQPALYKERLKRGEWMLRTLFGIEADKKTQCIDMTEMMGEPGDETDKLVLVDYTPSKPVFYVGGREIQL
jgi:hypothetical protein